MKNAFPTIQCLWLLLLVFCGSGATCNRGFPNPFAASGPPIPEVLLGGSNLDQVIAAVNQNSSRIVSYQTNNASMTVPGMPSIPLLRGNIAALQPGKVRMRATVPLAGDVLDVGSNDELFWFWVKYNEPPALYFSRHDQFSGSAAQQVMPIEPQWLLDALGMMQFSPNDRHEGPYPYGDNLLEIRSILQTRSGQMSKSTIINARTALVLEQHIYNAAGTLVVSTRARNHRYDPTTGVSLPKDIELRVPATQLSLSIDVGDVQVNALPDNPALWALPVMSGYPQVDLGTAQPGTVAPMGAIGSRTPSTFTSPAFVGLAPQSPLAPNEASFGVPNSVAWPARPNAAITPPPVASIVAQPSAPGPTYSSAIPAGQSRPVKLGVR